ncbi:DegT/DnrJ/EryC1/StrS family aminotransferase [Actinoalloteichus caeruleus]|uniref:dTDP-4-amino-4,6-dideoxygalactose transaminase n=1 Tax=Actinoalloteichus caeruleus DSM 43889 TaxID=1120930 RepID=A0ABT1JEL3_ACTCY|nr:DegT/DnrJ/EryC1/StrS family aminotransferase [Actinoalloteichus caeruleus]MCP2330937.1 dTDP-4-amino-4,6-dideoxygalactose transaminase [Actinoalloteichus caeruleus DSM 43889]
MNALALTGGSPVISQLGSHFSWPPITHATTKAVLDQLTTTVSIYDRSGVIAELEDALQEYFGVRHAVLTSSGTAAVHSTYAATCVEPGDEVIVPAYTFLATATPLFHLGAVPILADSDETGNMSVAEVEARITNKTTAIMVTHLWGTPADIDALLALANRHGLALLEDASHAHGATVHGQKVGTFGHTAAFSMNGPKPLSAGEGGFVLTDDDDVYHRVLLHGHYNKRCRNEIPATSPMHPYAVTGMGLKFRIHPLAAAIALDQLGSLDDYLNGRENVARYLCNQLGELPGIAVPRTPDGVRPAWYGLPLTYVPEELGGLPVKRFHEALLAEGLKEVDQPGSICPLSRFPLFRDPAPVFPHYPHRKRVAYREGQFPVAEQIWQHTLKLPVWHREEDLPLVDRYIDGLRKVIEHHTELLG